MYFFIKLNDWFKWLNSSNPSNCQIDKIHTTNCLTVVLQLNSNKNNFIYSFLVSMASLTHKHFFKYLLNLIVNKIVIIINTDI